MASTIALVIALDIIDDTKHSYVNADTSSSFTSPIDTSSCASFDCGSSTF